MWARLFGPESKRLRLLKQSDQGPLLDFYRQAFVDTKTPARGVDYVVLDFETTGLDIHNDHIISIGLIEIRGFSIHLDTAWHQIIKSTRDMPGETAVIHKITDDMLVHGMEVEDAVVKLLQRMKGKVLIAHHAVIELGFLNKICQKYFNQEFYMPVIDTELLAKRVFSRHHQEIKSSSLRLFNLRKKYDLPAYRAHNALSDALSTAELFLALLNDLYPKQDCRLKDLLKGMPGS